MRVTALAAGLVCAVGLATPPARTARSEPIAADRPGIAESTAIVEPGTLQLEVGFEFERQTGTDDPPTDTVTGLLAGLSFPTGSDAVSSDGFDPFGTLLFHWDVGERFGVDANVGFSGPTQGVDDGRRVFTVVPVVSVDGALTERLAAFVEYASEIRSRRSRICRRSKSASESTIGRSSPWRPVRPSG